MPLVSVEGEAFLDEPFSAANLVEAPGNPGNCLFHINPIFLCPIPGRTSAVKMSTVPLCGDSANCRVLASSNLSSMLSLRAPRESLTLRTKPKIKAGKSVAKTLRAVVGRQT